VRHLPAPQTKPTGRAATQLAARDLVANAARKEGPTELIDEKPPTFQGV
jgi:hypothetical protein